MRSLALQLILGGVIFHIQDQKSDIKFTASSYIHASIQQSALLRAQVFSPIYLEKSHCFMSLSLTYGTIEMMMIHKLIFKLFNKKKKDFKLSLAYIFYLELLLEAVPTFLCGGALFWFLFFFFFWTSLEDLRRENTSLVVKGAKK